MDIRKAVNILEALSRGKDPFNGESLRYDQVCADDMVQQALEAVLMDLGRDGIFGGCLKLRHTNRPANAGKPWNEQDENELLEMFEAGADNERICAHFKRTEGAIAARLVKLGRLQEREEFKKRRK